MRENDSAVTSLGNYPSYPFYAAVQNIQISTGVTNSAAIAMNGGNVKTDNTTYINQLGYNKGGSFETIVSATTPTADRLQIHQDKDGIIALTSDLTGFTSTDYYVTGATMNGNTLELGRNGLSDVTVDLSQFIDTDTSVTGLTFNPTTYDLTLSQDNGKSNLISNLAVLASDIFVLSGVYDISTGIVTYTTNSGTTFQVSGFTSGMTDSYTSNSYLVGNEIRFDNNIQGTNLYNVDLTPLLSGKTNNSDFYTYTGSTETKLNSKVDNSIFTSYTANTQNILNTKIDGGINNGGGHELFSGITGTDMNFRTLSGGSNTTLTTIGDVVKIDVSIPSDTNSYVTGGTVSGTDLILGRNGGLSDVTIDTSAYFDNTNYYVTGSTLNGNTLELGRNGGLSTLTTDLSTLNPDTTLDRKLFIPASMASNMGSSSITYHGTTGVALLAFGGNNPDNEQGSFPMLIPQDYVSGGTIELIYTTQTTANDVVWSFAITNCSDGEDFSTITESGAHLDLVSGGQTFLNRGTTAETTPTGTTFNINDAVTVRVNRDASDSRDTANNITAYIYGLIFNYKANN
jgi:hypothetical protein